ncbi:MAG: phage virion morphogenesis protein [Porticoccaceae bacterium]|nr:phage virion morphogenesis protein [Porticoccaceae bacterium]
MAGVRLALNQDDFASVDAVLAHAIKGDTGVLMAAIGEHVLAETLINFDREQTPKGDSWEASQRATAEGGKTLQDSRRLFQSYTYRASDERVDIGSNVIYAAIHHHGGATGRNHAVTLPARPALGLSPELQGEIDDLYTHWARDLFGGHRA